MRRTAWRYVNRLLRDSMISKTSPTEDVPSMSVMRNIFMHTFGRPQGVLGRLGGIIMARMNADCGAWVGDLLEVGPNDSVLEVGFGPGMVIQRLSKLAAAGHVAGGVRRSIVMRSSQIHGRTASRSQRTRRFAKVWNHGTFV